MRCIGFGRHSGVCSSEALERPPGLWCMECDEERLRAQRPPSVQERMPLSAAGSGGGTLEGGNR